MRRRLVLISAMALTIAACGGASTEDTTTTTESAAEETTTTAAPAATTTTVAPATTTTTSQPPSEAEMIPDPTTGVTLTPYSDENITAGDVFLYWYRDTDSSRYVGLYAGPGIAGAEGQGLCPGNSIQTDQFLHVSNTPSEEGACEGFPTETASIQACSGGVWLYLTNIPGDLSGTLFGSLEWNADDGTIKGLTSQFSTEEDIPEFAYGQSAYSLWEGFTADGSTEISCSDPS